jgi:hypothetical protein
MYTQGILDLMRVGLASVPIETFQLSNLQELNLSDNKIVELPPEFARLSTLEQLQVMCLCMSMYACMCVCASLGMHTRDLRDCHTQAARDRVARLCLFVEIRVYLC